MPCAPGNDVPPLRSLCLGYLGPHIPQLAAMPHAAVPLPAEIKAVLLCIARRRQELTDEVLLALVDSEWALMDLHGCSKLRASTIRAALSQLGQLRQLDLSKAVLTNETVYGLPRWLPHLRHLRLHGTYALVERAAWQSLVPAVAPVAAESWEDEPGSPSESGLLQLISLRWPYMPPSVAALYAEDWPKLHLEHSADAQQRSVWTHKQPFRPAQPCPSRIRSHYLPRADTLRVEGLPAPPDASGHERRISAHGAPPYGSGSASQNAGGAAPAAALHAQAPHALLDAPLAAQASSSAWRDLLVPEEQAFMQLHISERFRIAVQEAERNAEDRWRKAQARHAKANPLEAELLMTHARRSTASAKAVGARSQAILHDWLDSYE